MPPRTPPNLSGWSATLETTGSTSINRRRIKPAPAESVGGVSKPHPASESQHADWRVGLMMVVMVSTIVTVVSTMVAMIRMVVIHGMAAAAVVSPISPASPENTTGRGEQGDDAY